eukprot:m.215875 g.215875  ORF g.215875 m.215875 type:complete len:70 (+) comp43605_c0_seq1:199-408(+)
MPCMKGHDCQVYRLHPRGRGQKNLPPPQPSSTSSPARSSCVHASAATAATATSPPTLWTCQLSHTVWNF